MSVVIFHPSVAPFVQQAARALYEAELLERFYTTLFDNPRSGFQRMACALAGAAGKDLSIQLKRRAITEIPQDLVTGYSFREILRLLSGNLDRSGRLTDRAWLWAETGFDRAVSVNLSASLSGVYGFEHSSLHTFERAKELGLRVFYDLPAPETRFFQKIQETEMDAFPELRSPYQKYVEVREASRTERRHAEWRAADLVIVNSEFTKKSYVDAGLPEKKMAVVPYGAPPPIAESIKIFAQNGEPLNLLWAGTFSIRKGAHYLLQAWRKFDFGRQATLKVHGAVTLPEKLLHPLPNGVAIAGSIPREQLLSEYQKADVLIFPTLCDGFGMVVTEAFSCGLPVIATTAAGATDLIRNHENGIVIQPGSSDSIAEAIIWCLENRNTLAAMREAALKTAANWQWSDYRKKLTGELKRVLP